MFVCTGILITFSCSFHVVPERNFHGEVIFLAAKEFLIVNQRVIKKETLRNEKKTFQTRKTGRSGQRQYYRQVRVPATLKPCNEYEK